MSTFATVLERVEQAADAARSGGHPVLDADQLIADVSSSLKSALESELAAWPPLIRRMVERGQYDELHEALTTADQGPKYTRSLLVRYGR